MVKRLWLVVSIAWTALILGSLLVAGETPKNAAIFFASLPWAIWLLVATVGRWIVTGSWTTPER